MGCEGIRGRTGARAWEVIHIYTGSFTPSPDPTPFYRRLISTRKGGLTTNGIHLLIPASLSNRSGPPQPPIDRAALERRLGLDVPVYVQYGRWVGGIFLRGTLGDSLLGGFTIEEKIFARFPVTVELGVLALVIGFVIALPVGIYSAIRQHTAADYVGRSFAIIGLATPNFWLGLMVVIFPAIWWAWSPPMQLIPFREDPLGNLRMFLIPSAILGTALSAATMRMTRTMMLEVLRQDYIRTAWSKGLRERVVVVRHATRNALIPVVSLIGLQLPILVGGSVIMENIFNLPGLGRLMLDALEIRDYPLVSGINLLFATGVVLINLVIDLLYAYLDPRVRHD